MKLEVKVILLALFAALVPVAIIVSLILWQTGATGKKVDDEVQELVKLSIDKICMGIYDMCETTDNLVQAQVNQSLIAARLMLTGSDEHVKSTSSGKVILSAENATWDAINQESKEVDHLMIPKMEVNGQWLGQNRDFTARTPIIDEIVKVAGGTATIFQKMNEAGDMLRVATSVKTLDGKRAIGTYIPAKSKDGAPNQVVSTVLSGKTFRGRAFVVNAWYLTAYEPIRDSNNEIIGMLYVGVKQNTMETLRKKITETRVGSDGYVFVVGGQGERKGTYIISKNGEQDGKDIWMSTGSDGNLFIQELVQNAVIAKGDVSFQTYLWKNPGEKDPRPKIAAVRYYEPWDWVIGTTIYQNDLTEASNKVVDSIKSLLVWAIGGGIGIAIMASILAALLGAKFTSPICRITGIADTIANGNLSGASKEIKELSGTDGIGVGKRDGDEAEQLLYAIHVMIQNLNSLIGKVQQSGIHITSSSAQIAASSKQLEATVAEQATSTNEVLSTTTEISGVSKELASMMNNVSKSVTETATLAGNGLKDLSNMGESMERLASSTHAISSRLAVIDEKTDSVNAVVTTISKVADQTNLLSVNASIEAEKAGEHGKGFSVVARKIQQLADQTAIAMMDIEKIVAEMRSAVRKGVVEMDSFSDDVATFTSEVNRINEEQESIIKQVQELTPTVEDAREGINAQAQGAEQIRDAIVRLSEGAEQTAEALGEFRHTAGSLNDSAKGLQDEISKFDVSS
jgi:methyl-accepting chemotaxis protein